MNENTPALRSQQTDGAQISVFSGPSQFEAAQRMGMALCSATMVPDIYKGKDNLGNCLIALELANRTGASVLAVMQSMVPIHGKPSWSSAFLIATVNTCGRFTPLRFRFSGTEGADDWGCRAVAKDKESGEELVGSLITIALAKAEGWHGKNGSKWKTMPEQMLTYRAAAFWTRAYAPEVSLGMHTAEEARDMVDVTPEAEKPQGQRRTRPVSEPVVTVEAEVVPAEVETITVSGGGTVLVEPVEVPVQPEPTPAVPTLDQRRAGLKSLLAKNEIHVEDFLGKANELGWTSESVAAIEELDEVALNFVSKKWTKVILPALKAKEAAK